MPKVKIIHKDEELESTIKALGGDRCTVVYFFLTWCGSCQKMNPFVEAIAERNPSTLFLKVDAEKCMTTSKKHKISKVPLFLLYNSRTRVDRVEGASPIELESKIKRIQGEISMKKPMPSALNPLSTTTVLPSVKMTDITPYMDKKNCKVVNDLVPTAFQAFLEGSSKLVSGKGIGRLLLMYSFTENMVIQSFKIKAPIHSGPKVLRFFTTIGKNMDINDVNHLPAAQEVVLTEDDLMGEHSIDLRQGGFVGLTGLQIYIPESMTKGRRIELDFLILNGAPLTMTPFNITEDDKKTSHKITSGPGIRY